MKESERAKIIRRYRVTGTSHWAIIFSPSEGDARRAFHEQFNGESIVDVSSKNDLHLYV